MADRLTVGVAARLSRYLQVLTQAKKMGKDRISSQEISDYTNINATQIRRDLSGFGKFGKRGVGYNIESLLGEIRKILRTQGQHNIALVGAGRLGQAIASSPIFAEHGINIAAVLDTDPDKAGHAIGSLSVQPYSKLREAVRENNIIVGVLAVPADNAQQAANDLIDAGVKIIFNYSEALLDVPGRRRRPRLEPRRRAPLRAVFPPDLSAHVRGLAPQARLTSGRVLRALLGELLRLGLALAFAFASRLSGTPSLSSSASFASARPSLSSSASFASATPSPSSSLSRASR